MVFRGFLPGTQSLLSVTDTRSEKVIEWQGDNKSHFEICWYFSDSREQFRLAGEVALVSNFLDASYRNSVLGEHTKESLLKQQWSNLSKNAKEPFFSSSPKAPFDEDSIPPIVPILQDGLVNQSNSSHDTFDSSSAQNHVDESYFKISDNFCVIVFIPETVDYLNLKSKPQERCLYDIQDGWKERFVSP
jgi:hypothetical protein